MRRTNHYITHRYSGATVAVYPTLPLFYINIVRLFSLEHLCTISAARIRKVWWLKSQHYVVIINSRNVLYLTILSIVFSWTMWFLIFVYYFTVLSQDIPHIFAMTLFEEYIYWTDWETKSINRAHKTLGTNKSTLISTLHRPMDIHIYHPYRQPEGKRQNVVIA